MNPKHKWMGPVDLAEQIRRDWKAGLKLQRIAAPWIATIGTAHLERGSKEDACALEVGEAVQRQLGMRIATGGSTGWMHRTSEAAFKWGGDPVAIYLEGLPTEQLMTPYCIYSLTCKTLDVRQRILLSGACAVIVGPLGGIGTVYEFAQLIVEMRRQVFDPETPIVFITMGGLWHPFRDYLHEALKRGLWSKAEFDRVHFCDSAQEAIALLERRIDKVKWNLRRHGIDWHPFPTAKSCDARVKALLRVRELLAGNAA